MAWRPRRRFNFFLCWCIAFWIRKLVLNTLFITAFSFTSRSGKIACIKDENNEDTLKMNKSQLLTSVIQWLAKKKLMYESLHNRWNWKKTQWTAEMFVKLFYFCFMIRLMLFWNCCSWERSWAYFSLFITQVTLVFTVFTSRDHLLCLGTKFSSIMNQALLC